MSTSKQPTENIEMTVVLIKTIPDTMENTDNTDNADTDEGGDT